MQKKTSGKARHVVAWLNKAEWDQVLEYLYSKDIALQKHALHRVSAWKGRFGHSTPVAVESTADLVRCQVLDNSGQLEGDDLVLLYGMALVRFVNLITERQQKKVAKPLRRLASKMNIPEWIVNLRHDLTHRRLPSLKWCRKGCSFILEWLQQEYWSRQLGSRLTEDWDSSSDEEDDWAKNQEEEQLIRQKKIEAHKKARELLLSFEREQFQALQMARRGAQGNVWQEPSADLSWILAQVKHFTADSRETLIDVLLQDGFLIPTTEQLESLDINMSEGAVDVLTPCVPRVFLRFWLPLLKDLNSPSFVNAILDGLFAELRNEPAGHRGYYVAAWIAEILHCNSNRQRKMMKMKDRVFSNRLQLRWKHLITACLNAPCASTPYLLQQILSDMDKPLPSDTQHNLLRLCSIYTQSGDHGSCSHDNPDPAQPVYTLQSLQERLKGGATHKRLTRLPHHTLGTMQAPPPDHLEEELSTEALQERSMALRGSPWQVCPEKIPWKQYPLGKVPGQSEDPSSLMLESYTTLTVFDQQVELDQLPQHHANSSVPVQHRAGTEGPLWTHSDLSKLKAGLKLY